VIKMKFEDQESKSNNYMLVLLTLSLMMGCSSQMRSQRAGESHVTMRVRDRSKDRSTIIEKSIASVDSKGKADLVNEYLLLPNIDSLSRVNMLLVHGNSDQLRTRLRASAYSVNWNIMSVSPASVCDKRTHMESFIDAPGFDKAIKRGLKEQSSAFLKVSDEELNQLSMRQLVDLCEADGFLFRSKSSEAIASARKLVSERPRDEMLMEFYLIAVFRGEGWKSAERSFQTFKSKIHDEVRLARIEALIQPPNKVIFHTPTGDQVNKF
jgi:hypothetical protein